MQDVIEAIDFLAARERAAGIFNVGAGVARSWNDLVAATGHALNIQPLIEYIDMPARLRDQYQYFTCAPMDKLATLGWSPRFSVEDGTQAYVSSGAV